MIIPIHIVYKSFGFGDTVNSPHKYVVTLIKSEVFFRKNAYFYKHVIFFSGSENSLWHAISDKKFNKDINDCVHEYVNIYKGKVLTSIIIPHPTSNHTGNIFAHFCAKILPTSHFYTNFRPSKTLDSLKKKKNTFPPFLIQNSPQCNNFSSVRSGFILTGY